MGDGGVVGVFDGFALDRGEVWSFVLEQGGGGDVVLGIVGVLPDEEGGCGLDYVFATKRMRTRRGVVRVLTGPSFASFSARSVRLDNC